MSCVGNVSVSLKRKRGQPSRKKRRKNGRNGLKPSNCHINALPVEMLRHVFSFLPLRFLIPAQFVCQKWKDAALVRNLWEGYTLDVTNLPSEELEYRLSVLPGLRKIKGHTQGAYFNFMMKCVCELTKMNCTFDPPLSFPQLKRLLEKCPKIESLVLDIRSDDIVQSVEILKDNPTLKKLIFYCPCVSNLEAKVVYHHCCLTIPVVDKYVKIFKFLKDGFKNLEYLDISAFLCSYAFADKVVKDAVTASLIEKARHLATLKIPYIDGNMNAVLLAIQTTGRVKSVKKVSEYGISEYVFST